MRVSSTPFKAALNLNALSIGNKPVESSRKLDVASFSGKKKKKVRVVIVEDDKKYQRQLKDKMERAGYEVVGQAKDYDSGIGIISEKSLMLY